MRAVLPLTCMLVATSCATALRPEMDAVSEGRLAVEQGQIYYQVTGEGPAVVLIHGGFGDLRMWDAQFRDLARDFRVVRYDHRGFGRSPAPEAPYSPVQDLIRLLDHLQIDRAHLIGNSLGGALALDFALLHPERSQRLVVVASGANGYPYSEHEVQSVVSVFRAAQQEGLARAVELWLEHPMVALTSRDRRTRSRLRTMVEENRDVFIMQHWPSEPVRPSTFERLQEIRRPILFVVGERDTPLVRTAAQQSAARVPYAQWAEISRADHLPQMVRPDEFNELVRRFLQRLDPGPPHDALNLTIGAIGRGVERSSCPAASLSIAYLRLLAPLAGWPGDVMPLCDNQTHYAPTARSACSIVTGIP